MSKQLLNQRYIYKIKSDFLKRNNNKVKFKPNDIQKNIKQRYIVGIGDSTGLRITRNIINKKVTIDNEEYLYGS